jgi:hypothetical protein
MDGPTLLATAAEDNARTWQFAVHDPTTFTVTYSYALETEWKGDPNNPIVVGARFGRVVGKQEGESRPISSGLFVNRPEALLDTCYV